MEGAGKEKEQLGVERYIAFDIETSGAFLPYARIAAYPNSILSIGVCVIDVPLADPTQYHVQHEEYIVLHIPDDSQFEPECWTGFWSKPSPRGGADCLKVLRAHEDANQAKTDKEAATWVWNTLLKWQAFDGKVRLCSDNPAFDLSWLDYLTGSQLNGIRPISQYKVTADNDGSRPRYSMPLDISSAGEAILYARGYPKPLWKKRWEISNTIQTPHDHLPHHDARNMLETYLKILYSS